MTTPPLPSWAQRKGPAGPPTPGSPADQHFAAFVGPRWPTYRRKFVPFFEDGRFTPTWNWSAALVLPFVPLWFLYRKLYVPFVFFALAPSLAFRLLWGSDDLPPVEQVPNPITGVGTVATLTPDAALLALGILLSMAILAGGTANFLLYRRATAALRVVGAREREEGAALGVLSRVGGTSWRAVVIGVVLFLLLNTLATTGS